MEAFESPHAPQIPKKFQTLNYHVKINDKPHHKSPKLPWEKWWEVLKGLLAHKQVQWFEHPASEGQPQRKDWLSRGGGRKELVLKNWFPEITAA